MEDDVKRATLAFLRSKGLLPKEPVTFRKGRCSAHLYQLNLQGKKKWVTYQCQREGCSHFATLDNIRSRAAECWLCSEHFSVQLEQVVKKLDSKTVEERLFKQITCGCKFKELDEEIMKRLREELLSKKEDFNLEEVVERK